MYTIDQIFDMFASYDPAIRQKGVEAAKDVKYLSVFLQPIEGKFLWGRCAEVLASKSDAELKPYLTSLFMWLLHTASWHTYSCP